MFYAYSPHKDKGNLILWKITLLLQAHHKRLIQLRQCLASFPPYSPESEIQN